MAKKILLVDDEKETSSVFAAALRAGGYDVTVANDGKSAINVAKSTKFDAILLDQMMPDLSGNEVLKTLKADEATKSIPIAMLTNFSHDEMVKDALGAGAEEYILKYQISTDDLVQKTKKLVGE